MSPRSAEFLVEAQARLNAARRELAAAESSTTVSLAYYAMLYAARAALSEEDRYAKTHRGTWDLFWQTFVATGSFDAELASEARETQELRQLSDYEARRPSLEEATHIIDLGERFVSAVAELLGA
ncbi:MAG: HEPN domain-containing protein [Actinomycetota bacterium]|nr:HEPN domain-containing protein [Actinomycetota bacterium]